MSRTRQDLLDTEAMLTRLTNLLVEHRAPNLHGAGKDYVTYSGLPDQELGARKRLAQILKRYPGLTAYVQGDPRGCALYILKPGDVPKGATVDSCYSRGLAVYR